MRSLFTRVAVAASFVLSCTANGLELDPPALVLEDGTHEAEDGRTKRRLSSSSSSSKKKNDRWMQKKKVKRRYVPQPQVASNWAAPQAKDPVRTIYLEVTNLSFNQPFSNFFVMVHSKDVQPIFYAGRAASNQLADLAQDGNPQPLVDLYGFHKEVASVGDISNGNMRTFTIRLQVSSQYNYVTIAAMMMNTNDGFVALNSVRAIPGRLFLEPAYDAGTEANNEQCNSIPGPACDASSGNENPEDGEGVVHIHRGIIGGADLDVGEYSWLNPVMQVLVREEVPFIQNLN